MATVMSSSPPPRGAPAPGLTPRPIELEMQESYLDYAMSVIIARALPDVRDGLKPVHRRVLYAMWTLGLRANAKFRKSATIVGECLGKYHPHGDVAVYDSLVRMAQNFSLRYPLVSGQGNFGSLDGDVAAAMRYTEAKLAGIAEELLVDLEKDTVAFTPNYDGSQREPTVLPGRLPNLILNGSTGIAVGMATNIPPHNAGEICDALTHLASHPDATVDDLLRFVPGPDFPTGGFIFDRREIKQAYATGKGAIVMRAKADIVAPAAAATADAGRAGHAIVVTEIPYLVNKAQLVEHIAELVKDKKLEGIRDLRDESSERGGLRVVIELKKDAYPRKVVNQLFQRTLLQSTYHVNLLALVDGIQPRVLTLKAILEEHLKHRREMVRKRTAYDLARAEERAHILEGLKLALAKIDDIIATIKKSQDKDQAKANLITRFKLSERQAVAILEMRLQQLANLERISIAQELNAKLALIKALQAILHSSARITGVITDEINALKAKYGDARRTQVVSHGVKEFTQEDLIPDEDIIVALTRDGYIKALPPQAFRTQERGGKGVIGLTTKEEDFVAHFFSTTTHANLLFFTSSGRVFQLSAYEIPKASRQSRGTAIVNFLQLGPHERISAALPLPDRTEAKFLVMVTTKGQIKKVNRDDFANVRRSGLMAIRLRKNDELEWVKPSSGSDTIMLVTGLGQSIRFPERQLRPMGRAAAGVRGVRLKGTDAVVGMDVVDVSLVNTGQLLTVMAKGFGKRSGLKGYKIQGRGGSGIKTAKITAKTGGIITAMVVNGQALEADLIIISAQGQVIRLPLTSVPVRSRATQGVRLMRFKQSHDQVASVTLL